MQIGFLAPSIISVPVGLPPIITAFIGFGVPGVVVQLIGLALCCVLYFPFVMLSNRQGMKESANG